MTIFTEYISSILKCICFYILAFLRLWWNNRIPLGWVFIVPLWGGNDSFGRYAQIYLSSFLLRVCIGITEHNWVSMPCQVSSKELYTNSQLNVKLLNEESYRLEKSSINLKLLAEIIIIEWMIIIPFFLRRKTKCFVIKERTEPKRLNSIN